MTAAVRPPCRPHTLGDPCTRCKRPLHYGRPRGASKAICELGHPRHDRHGTCGGCAGREERPRSTAPPCDPATLGDPCPGCARPLHYGRFRGASKARCAAGHPCNDTHGLCHGCADRYRAQGIPLPDPPARRKRRSVRKPVETVVEKVPMPALTHSYCVHDEGERCDCPAEYGRAS